MSFYIYMYQSLTPHYQIQINTIRFRSCSIPKMILIKRTFRSILLNYELSYFDIIYEDKNTFNKNLHVVTVYTYYVHNKSHVSGVLIPKIFSFDYIF